MGLQAFRVQVSFLFVHNAKQYEFHLLLVA
jgi:hypothetical protein